MAEPAVYVLIINWNGVEHLEACFDTLLASTHANLHCWLVDNGSTDESVDFVAGRYGADERVEIVPCGGNLGWSGGNNVGMEQALAAGADYIFLLNNDTAIAPDAIAHLVAQAESDTSLGALAPKMVLFSHPDVLNSVGLVCTTIGSSWDLGIGRQDGPRWNDRGSRIGVCGGAMFIRASVLEKTGLLPEDFEIYMDDLDLCLRIWDSGYGIAACPEAVVRHKFSASFGTGVRARYKYYLNTRNRFRLLARNFSLRMLLAAVPDLVLGECKAVGRATLSGEFWRVLAHGKAWANTVLHLPALIQQRRARNARVGRCGSFVGLVQRRPLFCPAIALPSAGGWYGPITWEDHLLRPLGKRAVYDAAGGKLQLEFAQLHPELGPITLEVVQAGEVLATLTTKACDSTIVPVQAGPVLFEAKTLFEAERTGRDTDYGGWIAVHALQDDQTVEQDKN